MSNPNTSPLTNPVGPNDLIRVIQEGCVGHSTPRQLAMGLPGAFVLAQSAAPASVTGTLTPTVLASVVIPGGSLKANGVLRVTHRSTVTNSANTKNVGIQLGATTFGIYAVTTSNGLIIPTEIIATNSTASQWCLPGGNGYGPTGASPNSGSLDMTVDQTLNILGTLANTADTITLRSYTVEILNP